MLATLRQQLSQHKYIGIIIVTWALIVSSLQNSIEIIFEYFAFLFLGILGAIFANATGAGGGVVFVPFFNQLSLSNQAIVATSFAIQCCGMTAGALTWHRYYQSAQQHNKTWSSLYSCLLCCIPFAILGIVIAQYALTQYSEQMQNSLHVSFGIFSIFLALAIYASIPLLKRSAAQQSLQYADKIALAVVSLVGGMITAYLSVGVGELVAVYLILRGFNITFSIAVAVILSAFTVWSAVPFHVFVSQAIYWQVVLFAGIGAILGGMLAKHLVLRFSIVKLKVFFATWVLIMGVLGLPL